MTRWAFVMVVVLLIGCGPKGEDKKVGSADPAKTNDPAAKDPKGTDPEGAPKPAPKPKSPEPSESSKAIIGSPELTGGIPGEGELTNEQIERWLETPGVHDALEVSLPPGVAWGTIQGVAENPISRAKVELGRQLYFDTRLSADNTVSCASCHHPDYGYAFNTQFGVGIDGQTGGRNSPVAYNRIFSGPQFWDGRADSLEAQAVGPIANPIEMGNTHEEAVKTVAAIAGYKMQFDKVFPGEGVTIDNIGRAIATFERTLVTGPSPYDYFEPLRVFEKQFADDLEDVESFKQDEPRLYGRYTALKKASDEHPMSEAARRGRALFFGRAKCTACHAGANFTDEKYHNIGVGMAAEDPDLGRYNVTNMDKDRGAFKTPTCRNVTQTAPYMHDGSQKTLLDVVKWYDEGGHKNDHLSKDIVKLNLTDQEEQDLVAFMEALTGDLPKVETGRLPQ